MDPPSVSGSVSFVGEGRGESEQNARAAAYRSALERMGSDLGYDIVSSYYRELLNTDRIAELGSYIASSYSTFDNSGYYYYVLVITPADSFDERRSEDIEKARGRDREIASLLSSASAHYRANEDVDALSDVLSALSLSLDGSLQHSPDDLMARAMAYLGNLELTASAAEDVSYSPDGNLTITGFDSTSGHDLMTASRNGMPGDNPQPVAFTFNHTLSAVRFVVKTDPNTLEANPGFEIRLLEASLYGLPVKGNYSIENFNEHWTYSDSDLSTQSMPFASMENENDVSGNIEFSLFGEDDSLVIPVSPLSSLSAVLEMSYRTRQGESSDWSETKYRTIELSSLSHGWSAGLRYRYTATIGDYLTFSVNVSAWNTSTGGIITVE